MTHQNDAAQTAEQDPLSDEYVNAVIQRHGYQSPETVCARLYQWIGLHGGENGVTLLIYEAHKVLSKLRAPVADELVASLRRMASVAPASECEVLHAAANALASAPVAGEAQKPPTIAFVNGEPAPCGCTVRFSDGGGEYSNVHYVTLCDTHSGAALLSKVIETGELTRPQHEDLEGEVCAALDVGRLKPADAAPQASEAVRDALMAFDGAMSLCNDFPELQHHRDALLFAVQKARAALSAQPGAQTPLKEENA